MVFMDWIRGKGFIMGVVEDTGYLKMIFSELFILVLEKPSALQFIFFVLPTKGGELSF